MAAGNSSSVTIVFIVCCSIWETIGVPHWEQAESVLPAQQGTKANEIVQEDRLNVCFDSEFL